MFLLALTFREKADPIQLPTAILLLSAEPYCTVPWPITKGDDRFAMTAAFRDDVNGAVASALAYDGLASVPEAPGPVGDEADADAQKLAAEREAQLRLLARMGIVTPPPSRWSRRH